MFADKRLRTQDLMCMGEAKGNKYCHKKDKTSKKGSTKPRPPRLYK